jgi:hypothetical protein
MAAPCPKTQMKAEAPRVDADGDVAGRVGGVVGDVGAAVDARLPDVDASARVDVDVDARRKRDDDDDDGRLSGPVYNGKVVKPVGKGLWIGLGITAGTTAVLFGTSMGLLGNLRGAMRDNLEAKAKLSLTDADPSNDIDVSGDICAQARGGTNSAVAGLCDLSDARRRAVIGTGITAGLLASVVIVLGAVIGHRRRQCDDRTAQRRFNMAVAPRLGGGVLVTEFKF